MYSMLEYLCRLILALILLSPFIWMVKEVIDTFYCEEDAMKRVETLQKDRIVNPEKYEPWSYMCPIFSIDIELK